MSYQIIVYQIYHIDPTLNIIYVGSTKRKLYQRWNSHKQDYKKWKSGKVKNKCSIVEYFEKYGVENFKCSELRSYMVNDKETQLKYEEEWVNTLECVNKYRVIGITKQERVEEVKESKKHYCELCDYKAESPSKLRIHENGEGHWRLLFPCYKLDYNMERSTMSWERKLNKQNWEKQYRQREEVKQRLRENHKRHEQTEKGKETLRRYRTSEKCKETRVKRLQKIVEEKKYYCEDCDKAFQTKQKLDYHLQSKIHKQ